MEELDIHHFFKVLPLINEVKYLSLFAHEIIQGKQSGRIFVDQKVSPTSVLVFHKCGLVLLCGNEQNGSFNQRIPELLFATNSETKPFNLVFGENWSFVLKNLISSQVGSLSLVDFIFDHQEFKRRNSGWRTKVPEGYILKRLQTFEEINSFHGTYVPSLTWNSIPDFLKNGVAYGLFLNQGIISICSSAFFISNMMEFETETVESFRSRGLGFFAGAALIEECIQRNISPVWCSESSNIPSRKLAKKLGFIERQEYMVYCWTNKGENI